MKKCSTVLVTYRPDPRSKRFILPEGTAVKPVVGYGALYSVTDSGLVIAHDKEGELRNVFEEILPHEASRDDVAPGKLLDAALGPASPFLSLDGSHETRSAKSG